MVLALTVAPSTEALALQGVPEHHAASGIADGGCDALVFCTYDVPYGGGPNQTLDVYWSTVATGQASVILIHGGGWMGGSSRDMGAEAVYFAQNGFAVFSINYTLSTPETPDWPQVYDDVEAAAGWVHDHAADYGADGSRMAAVGASAGAHLAGLLDTAGPESGHPLVTSVSWSGPPDLGLAYRDGNDYVHLAIEQLLGCIPGACAGSEDVVASPISHVTADDGSMLLINSRRELVPISGARAMKHSLASVDVPHRLIVLTHTHAHATEYECFDTRLLGRTQPIIDGTVRWLSTYLYGRPLTPTGTYCG